MAFLPWRVSLSFSPVYTIYSFTIVTFFKIATYAYVEPLDLLLTSIQHKESTNLVHKLYVSNLFYYYILVCRGTVITLMIPETSDAVLSKNPVQ